MSDKLFNDWSDIHFAYHIGQIVYMVYYPAVAGEQEPIIADWVIDGLGIDKDRHPMYHLETPSSSDFRWRNSDRFEPENELLPNIAAAQSKKTKMWEECIADDITKEFERLNAWAIATGNTNEIEQFLNTLRATLNKKEAAK